ALCTGSSRPGGRTHPLATRANRSKPKPRVSTARLIEHDPGRGVFSFLGASLEHQVEPGGSMWTHLAPLGSNWVHLAPLGSTWVLRTSGLSPSCAKSCYRSGMPVPAPRV